MFLSYISCSVLTLLKVEWLAMFSNLKRKQILACAPDRFMPKVMEMLNLPVLFARFSLSGTFGSVFTLVANIKSLVHDYLYCLININKYCQIVPLTELEIELFCFFPSRLSYCNSLFSCPDKASLEHLQAVKIPLPGFWLSLLSTHMSHTLRFWFWLQSSAWTNTRVH